MSESPRELEVANALAAIQVQRARGETPDVLAFRDRLGESHGHFVDILQVDELIDDFTDPPAPERLPRDFGGYRLVRELGQGAIGVVYEGWHKTLGRKAAIKVLRAGFDRDPEARERFRNEAYATAQVRHDHIVEIFEAGEVGGSPFYAMGLVEGRPLSALIASKEVPPMRDLCRELAGIADALDKLHDASPSIVHRDVKPSNIMVRPDGRMILADFGLARADNGLALTRTGVAIGTPLYMPPEQMLGRRDEIDARADVYALGATLYETVALRPVFPPSTLEIVSKQVISERPLSLRTVAPNCPAAVERIAMKALEKRREDRYPTARAMRDQLLLVAEGKDESVRGGPVSPVRRVLRWARTPSGLAAAASGLLVIGTSLWWTHRPARLDMTSLPGDAEVWVGGTTYGRTPLSLPLKPGSYEIFLRRDGFVERPRHVTVSAGEKQLIEFALVPKDLDDPIARLAIAESLRVDTLGYRFERTRGSGTPLVFAYPRGSVRISDLDQYGFEFDSEAGIPEEGGTLEFGRAGEPPLHREAFGSDYRAGRNVRPFPKDVRRQLRVGDVVTWGLRWKGPSKDRDVIAKFTVVDTTADAALAEFGARLAKLEYPPEVAGEFEVRELWKHGLMTAALAKADPLADAHPDSSTLQALAKLAHIRLKITDSSRMKDLTRRIELSPKAEQDRLASTIADDDTRPDGAGTRSDAEVPVPHR